MKTMKLGFILALVFSLLSCQTLPKEKPVSGWNVQFFTDGGTEVPMQDIPDGGTVKQTKALKEGYLFTGWYLSGLDTPYDFATPVHQNLNLHARWHRLVTVTFDATGGSTVDPVSLTEGATINFLATPTKADSTFIGWYLDDKGEQPFDPSTPLDQDLTLYAKWETEKVTVTFNTNSDLVQEEAKVDVGSTYTPEALHDDLYLFSGWFKDPACTTPYNPEEPILEDITLHAKWKLKLSITFNGNDGAPEQSITATIDAPIPLPSTPVKTNYTFDGWYNEEEFNNLFKGDFTLYAKWYAAHAVVSFDTEGIDDIVCDHGSTITLPDAPKKPYHQFLGWYTDLTLTTPFDPTEPIIADMTLYAKWAVKQCTVTLESNGGTKLESIVLNTGSHIDLPTAEKEGSHFDGWYTDKELTQAFQDETIDEDLLLFAKWTKQTVAYQGDEAVSLYTPGSTVENLVVAGKTIRQGAFQDEQGLSGTLTLEDGITRIGANAFTNDAFTGELSLPSSCTLVGNAAFKGTTFDGTVKLGDSLLSVGEEAFADTLFSGELTLPSTLEEIGRAAFRGCSALSGMLVIPASVRTLGKAAFSGCSSLSGFSFATPVRCTVIDDELFHDCSRMVGVLTLPETITAIGNKAFAGCSGLIGSLVLPKNLTYIGEEAFSGCVGFTGTLELPETLQYIGKGAFAGTAFSTQLWYHGTAESWKAMTKAEGWNDESGITKVYCDRDGTIIVL